MDMMWYRRRGLMATSHIESVGGSIASFNSDYNKIPVKSLICNIEPIQEGSGDPSPENVRPISGRTGVSVVRTGNAQQWDEEYESGAISVADGSLISVASYMRSKNFIPVAQGKRFYRAGTYMSDGRAFFYDQNKAFITHLSIASIGAFDIPSGACFMLFHKNGATYNHDISINYPATDTEYHAYKGSTYSVNWETEAGTVYGGTLDVVSGVLVIDRGVGVFDGSSDENWMKYNMGSASAFAMKITVEGMKKAHAESAIVISNELTSLTPGTVWGSNESFISTQSESEILVAGINTITVVDNWRAYLASSPLQVVYELATPVTYQLTPHEVKTLLGDNNIWCNSGSVSVDYWKWRK